MKELKIIEFIKNNKDWEKQLSKAPYYISIHKDKVFSMNLALLKYEQRLSDFNNELVRECRGIVIDLDNIKPICIPFFKFGNYGESYCPNINWKNVCVLEKIDGSLIKVVKINNKLLVSTNGNIDASKVEIPGLSLNKYKTFYDLFRNAEPIKNLTDNELLDMFDENYTYMFELTSPYNRIVVPYSNIKLSLIGIRNNITYIEENIFDSELKMFFDTPKKYLFKTLEECIKSAKELPYTEEGYVAVDDRFSRVKIKSLEYIKLHHLKNGNNITDKKIISMIQQNEIEEFLTYFPEYKDIIYKMKSIYDNVVNTYEKKWNEFLNIKEKLPTRKEQSIYINNNFDYVKIAFNLLDGKIKSVKDYFDNLDGEKFINYFIKNKNNS